MAKLKVGLSSTRRELLERWLQVARIKAQEPDGNYTGMDSRETKEIDEVLDDIEFFCKEGENYLGSHNSA